MNKFKCVLSLRVARQLMSEGYTLHDIEPSKKRRGQLVFIFTNSERLERRLSELKQK